MTITEIDRDRISGRHRVRRAVRSSVRVVAEVSNDE